MKSRIARSFRKCDSTREAPAIVICSNHGMSLQDDCEDSTNHLKQISKATVQISDLHELRAVLSYTYLRAATDTLFVKHGFRLTGHVNLTWRLATMAARHFSAILQTST